MESETPSVQKNPPIFSRMKKLFASKMTGLSLVVFLLILAFVAGLQYGQKNVTQASQSQIFGPISSNEIGNRSVPGSLQGKVDFEQFWTVWDLVSQTYLDKSKVDSQKMMYGAISGMVSALGDPYTTYLPPTENKQSKDELGGNFEGVGMELGFKDNRLVVIAPLDDTPAQRAGILAGDLILKIDGKETDGLSLPEAVLKIRGQKGTKVTLELYRQGADKPFTTELTRERIHVTSVTYTKKDGNIGYIKVSRFGDETNKEWDDAITKAIRDNVPAVVIDVRNNPGGYLQSAIYLASEFIDGSIVKQEKSDGSKQTFSSVRRGKLLTKPVVVLINKGSASASEILAGALVANNRAKTFGETSFGKGTIQEVQDLDKGAGIHITRARWLMPNDYWVHEKGLKPDVEVPMTAEDIKAQKDPQLDKALEFAQSL